jgi:protein gp37
MNKQGVIEDGRIISRGIEWTHIFGPGTGFTANPVRGCAHQCRWRMPDGTVVICYAKSQRDRIDGDGAFETITFHPDVFQKIAGHKSRAGIFIDSMSDLLGEGSKSEWIEETLSLMRECVQHQFFVLTKNPRRLTEFSWPKNAIVGMSSPPTFMFGKELNVAQQRTWFKKGFEWLMQSNADRKWVSFEPLVIDVTDILAEYEDFDGGNYPALDWAVIGAGSDGRRTHQPDELIFAKLLDILPGVPVFYKSNLDRALAERHGGWREEFPKL